jgi:hypothetical protein
MSCIDLIYYNPIPKDEDKVVLRNAQQKEVLKYFRPAGGCIGKLFFKSMTDEKYQELLAAEVAKIDKQKALDKLGLDESQVNEIEPIHFEGYYYSQDQQWITETKWVKKLVKQVSSAYEITWIFFGDTQLYVYKYLLNMDRDEKKETTDEYFYKDITNFSTTTDTVQKDTLISEGGCLKGDKWEMKNINMNRFQISVMGDKFYCSVEQNEYTENAIKGMKAKLREKKV